MILYTITYTVDMIVDDEQDFICINCARNYFRESVLLYIKDSGEYTQISESAWKKNDNGFICSESDIDNITCFNDGDVKIELGYDSSKLTQKEAGLLANIFSGITISKEAKA